MLKTFIDSLTRDGYQMLLIAGSNDKCKETLCRSMAQTAVRKNEKRFLGHKLAASSPYAMVIS